MDELDPLYPPRPFRKSWRNGSLLHNWPWCSDRLSLGTALPIKGKGKFKKTIEEKRNEHCKICDISKIDSSGQNLICSSKETKEKVR
jgi:hypothetical protein